jgi:hypothetical protein
MERAEVALVEKGKTRIQVGKVLLHANIHAIYKVSLRSQ